MALLSARYSFVFPALKVTEIFSRARSCQAVTFDCAACPMAAGAPEAAALMGSVVDVLPNYVLCPIRDKTPCDGVLVIALKPTP